MRKLVLATSLVLASCIAQAQIIDVEYPQRYSDNDTTQESNVQFLKNGFLDLLTDGSVQASARILRINIGEYDKFYLPLYIYSGVSENTFGSSKLNRSTVSSLLNTAGGLLNFSFNGLQKIAESSSGDTRLKFAYQFGGRMINGKDTITKDNLNFFNALGNAGLFFQTNAWPDNDPKNKGVFYIQAKATGTSSSPEKLKRVFGDMKDNFFWGYTLDAGIEINKVINLKVGLYQFVNNQGIEAIKKPTVKFSLDYTLKK